jgi:hypothetical protein
MTDARPALGMERATLIERFYGNSREQPGVHIADLGIL